ncbi:MAG: GTP cyclohydrolase I FolE2 [Gammaproteobacteria bacterium AqS3]|nr:GTP cyclohydrolase I FolE2 [Gammaproteobacteria bacterium AqS3]
MPDIAAGSVDVSGRIDWVGMSNIALILQVPLADGSEQSVRASADVYVNLNRPDVRGVHMSRMFLLLDQFSQKSRLTPQANSALLDSLLDSHEDLSDAVSVTFRFDLLLRRPALISDNSGWREYPVELKVERRPDGRVRSELQLQITYSSTCPCSQALARTHIREQFNEQFGGGAPVDIERIGEWLESSPKWASAHSQRSEADVRLRLDEGAQSYNFEELIEGLENTLGTPVQTAVKREDEQEFARLNGENPLFVEDASRRLGAHLRGVEGIDGFWLRVQHYESLHAHDAIAVLAHNYGEPPTR